MVMANVLHPSIPNLKRPLGREVREGDGVPGVPVVRVRCGEFQIPINPQNPYETLRICKGDHLMILKIP